MTGLAALFLVLTAQAAGDDPKPQAATPAAVERALRAGPVSRDPEQLLAVWRALDSGSEERELASRDVESRLLSGDESMARALGEASRSPDAEVRYRAREALDCLYRRLAPLVSVKAGFTPALAEEIRARVSTLPPELGRAFGERLAAESVDTIFSARDGSSAGPSDWLNPNLVVLERLGGLEPVFEALLEAVDPPRDAFHYGESDAARERREQVLDRMERGVKGLLYAARHVAAPSSFPRARLERALFSYFDESRHNDWKDFFLPRVRRESAELLGRLGTERAVEWLSARIRWGVSRMHATSAYQFVIDAMIEEMEKEEAAFAGVEPPRLLRYEAELELRRFLDTAALSFNSEPDAAAAGRMLGAAARYQGSERYAKSLDREGLARLFRDYGRQFPHWSSATRERFVEPFELAQGLAAYYERSGGASPEQSAAALEALESVLLSWDFLARALEDDLVSALRRDRRALERIRARVRNWSYRS